MIALGSDLAGLQLKHAIIKYLESRGIEHMDVGCCDEETADYPVYANRTAKAVLDGTCAFGIIVCGTGLGSSMMANRIKGIRCAVCGDVYSAKMTRSHNDANMLALGARVLGEGPALEIVDAFLNTPFSNEERHIRRIKMLDEL